MGQTQSAPAARAAALAGRSRAKPSRPRLQSLAPAPQQPASSRPELLPPAQALVQIKDPTLLGPLLANMDEVVLVFLAEACGDSKQALEPLRWAAANSKAARGNDRFAVVALTVPLDPDLATPSQTEWMDRYEIDQFPTAIKLTDQGKVVGTRLEGLVSADEYEAWMLANDRVKFAV